MKPQTLLSLLLLTAFLASPAALAQEGRKGASGGKGKPAAGKLYRWTDAQGKVHYTDTLPPEALEQGRTEYSRKGSLLNQVERPPTAEEKALEEQQSLEKQRLAEEDQARARDQLAFKAAYPTTEAIEREFAQRRATLEGQITALQAMVTEHRKNLLSQLQIAANAELQGKSVAPKITDNIQQLAKQVRQSAAQIQSVEDQIKGLEDRKKEVVTQWQALQVPTSP